MNQLTPNLLLQRWLRQAQAAAQLNVEGRTRADEVGSQPKKLAFEDVSQDVFTSSSSGSSTMVIADEAVIDSATVAAGGKQLLKSQPPPPPEPKAVLMRAVGAMDRMLSEGTVATDGYISKALGLDTASSASLLESSTVGQTAASSFVKQIGMLAKK